MKDSILKGTGNSRFLKSDIPEGTSWADALAMLQAGTFPIDFNGINAEGFQQVGTPLNKANLLKDATAAQIGLPPSTTPDGMFQALGNTGELHVWRKTVIYNQPVPEVPGSYTLGSAAQCTAGRRNTSTSSSSYISNLSVSNEISVDLDGNVTLVNPSTVSLRVTRPASFASDSARTALGGYCYFMATDDTIGEACDMYLPRGKIFYVAENAVYTYAIKQYDSTSSFDAAQLVTGVPGTPAIPAGTTTTTYPVSTNPNAYQEGSDAKPAGYTLGEVVTGENILSPKSTGSSWSWNYSDSVSVDENGVMSLVNQNSLTLKSGMSASSADVLIGKYVKQPNAGLFGDGYLLSGGVFYIPNNAVVTQKYGGGNSYTYFTIDRYQPVTGYAAIPAGTTIEYLGKLGDKARVQVVSYIGTNTYGQNNPQKVSVDFRINSILYLGYYRHEHGFYHIFNGNQSRVYVNINQVSTFYERYIGFHSNGEYVYGKKSQDEKTFFWYSSNGVSLNSSGYTYYFLVIG